ncbi:MAG: hypothetical protein HYV38_03750 [Candidatus Levybacteria bacterium]|nr:hypothetical protein [Candidatus Levybacteria bacterium]MBI2421170.1 hypothetical protein [Candidatus Levybacteria bacterium]
MPDFNFLKDSRGRWIISAPKRAKRPNNEEHNSFCPFCPGMEKKSEEVFRVGNKEKWSVRVIKNSFPFADIHEVIIHSPDHHKNFDELPLNQNIEIFRTLMNRFSLHKDSGRVFIFHNHGEAGGESITHPHTQLAVIPFDVDAEIPPLPDLSERGEIKETSQFQIFCPMASEWPDEVWIKPKREGAFFPDMEEGELSDFSKTVYKILQIFTLRYHHEFPFNFYIYPDSDWYLRFIPRMKVLGGFEIGTKIPVNTQDPKETLEFIKRHFDELDSESAREEKWDYEVGV